MLHRFAKIDDFSRNILIVFGGASLSNFLNLLYQLLIAHKLPAADFAAFNSLISIYMIIAVPVGTLQVAVAKFSAEYNARNEADKVKNLLSLLLKKAALASGIVFLAMMAMTPALTSGLKIQAASAGYLLAVLAAISCLTPALSGAIQGLEFFGWMSWASIITGAAKLALAFIFIIIGLGIAGALGGWAVSAALGLAIFYFPLKRFIALRPPKAAIDWRRLSLFLLPVAASNFCFTALVSFDMVMVKSLFSPAESGLYALAQMPGKIFLFLPGAVTTVMFPRSSGLAAKNEDTRSTLRRSLLYAFLLCACAAAFYNAFPVFTLNLLTGKANPQSVFIARLFSISMTFFALAYVMVNYFISLHDLRFIKFMAGVLLAQYLAVYLFHASLGWVQGIICASSAVLFCSLLLLSSGCAKCRT